MGIDSSIFETFSNPTLWCESYLRDPRDKEKPLILRSYQREVTDNSREQQQIILRFGRRMGKSVVMCADCLWWAQAWPLVNMAESGSKKQKPFTILVFAPYESQVKELWNTFSQLIGDSPLLKDQVAKMRTSDVHSIEFKNGSIIKGYTIGISSSNQGTSLRGLCLDGDTRISMYNGSTKAIKDINIGDKVISYDIKSKMFTHDKIIAIAPPEEKELYEILTSSGRKIKSSLDHKFLTDKGYLSLKDLTINDKIALGNKHFVKGNLKLNPNEIKLAAYLIGDGSVSDHRIKNSEVIFTNTNEKILSDYEITLDNLGYYHKRYHKKCNNKIIDIAVTGIKRKQAKFYDFLKKFELDGKIHNTKHIPHKIKTSTQKCKKLFLRHLYSTDGWGSVYESKQGYMQLELGYCSTSYTLVQDIQDMLFSFGIYSKIQDKKYKFELKIRDKYNIHRFLTEIGFIFGKESICTTLLNFSKKGNRIKRVGEFDTIIDITKIGVNKCYDITTGKHHNFLANGLVTHNSGDLIFIDEMDFIPTDIIEQVILPIATTHRTVKMRVCSTPSGARNLYFTWCTKAKELGWLHLHYPSWHKDNDNWLSQEDAKKQGIPIQKSTEFQVRSVTTSDAYAREYGAEFGEEFGGVYKNHLINRCLNKYGRNIDVSDPDIFDPGFQQKPEHKYIIGVDWNSYINGGQVVMLEYCSTPTIVEYFDDDKKQDITIDFTGKYRLFYRRGIKSKKATQRMTRAEIIRLMTHYKVDYLYVDYGAGDTNIEELSLHGRQHPELQMERKLRVIDSGATVDHYDHILQKTVKKRNKSLMINFSVLSLEEGMFLLPKEEDTQTRLIGQMRGYKVKNVTTRGEFAYEGEDHILDAFNLAIYGFQQNYGQLLSSRVPFSMTHFPDPRIGEYPIRGSIEEPSEGFHQNPFGIQNNDGFRDPETLPKLNRPTRIQMPRFGGRSLNLRRGGRGTF